MKHIKLYNPYHDKLGRFTSKTGGGAAVGSLWGPTGMAVGAGVGAAEAARPGVTKEVVKSRAAKNVAQGGAASIFLGLISVGLMKSLSPSEKSFALPGAFNVLAGLTNIAVGVKGSFGARGQRREYIAGGGKNKATLEEYQSEIDGWEVRAGRGWGNATIGAVMTVVGLCAIRKDAPRSSGYRQTRGRMWDKPEYRRAQQATHPDMYRNRPSNLTEKQHQFVDNINKRMSVAYDAGDAKALKKLKDDLGWLGIDFIEKEDMPEITVEDIQERLAITMRIFEDFLESDAKTLRFPGPYYDHQEDLDRPSVEALLDVIKIMSGEESVSAEFFNPYHDRLGRFTTMGVAVGSYVAGKKATRAVLEKTFPSKRAARKAREEKKREARTTVGLPEETLFPEKKRGKDLLGAPKKAGRAVEDTIFRRAAGALAGTSKKSKLARFIIDNGMDIALYALVGAAIISTGGALGALAGTALIGGTLAPGMLSIAGIVGTSFAWNWVTEPLTDKAFYGFVNKYSPRDKEHIQLSMTGVKKASRAGKRAFMLTPVLMATNPFAVVGAIVGTGGSVMLTGGAATMLGGASSASFMGGAIGASAGGMRGFAEPSNEETEYNLTGDEHNKSVMTALAPTVFAVGEGIVDNFIIPKRPETSGVESVGFKTKELKGKPVYVIDKKGANKFKEVYNSRRIPDFGSFIFGDVKIG